MSGTLDETIPEDEKFTGKVGSVKPKKIDKLSPEQRQWSNNVMRALGLQSQSSQARVLSSAVSLSAAIELDEDRSKEDKDTARQLRDTVLSAGTPPWKDTKKAMRAGSAKVQLDLLSIPEGERSLSQLDPEKKGINQAFWIERVGLDGEKEKSFLCKPKSKPTSVHDAIAPSGAPVGGEVAREALSGRAAQLLAGQTGIDIGMPETHVVKLDGALMGGTGGEQVTCSVQEARKAVGDLKHLSENDAKGLDSKQIAGLAIFDTLTLNTDRHKGNVLRDPDGNLIPIDHGESFAERNEDGVTRIKATMGGPHNALLMLPGAHEPLPPDMLKKLKAFNPDAFASEMKKDNARIGSEHEDMAGMVSNGAIENSRRAGMFLKMAAKNNPALSPAQIQVAMGNAADRLFAEGINEKTFVKNAQDAIARIAGQQQAVKDVCTMPDAEYKALCAKAVARGWRVADRNKAPADGVVTDPLTLLKIIKEKIDAPKKNSQQVEMLKELDATPANEMFSPDDATDVIVENRQGLLNQLLPLMEDTHAQEVAKQMAKLVSVSRETLPKVQSLVLQKALGHAMQHQTDELQKLIDDNRIQEMLDAGIMNIVPTYVFNAQSEFAENDPVGAAVYITRMAAGAQNGYFLPAEARNWEANLISLAEILMVSRDDDDVQKGLAEAKKQDPFGIKAHYDRLQQRAQLGEFTNDLTKLYQSELDDLTDAYAIPQNLPDLIAVANALEQGDFETVKNKINMLQDQAKNNHWPPTGNGLTKLAALMGVPDNDEDLLAIATAINDGNGQVATELWGKLRKRAQDGEFAESGKDALDDARKRLDTLTNGYDVPTDNSALLEATGFLLKGDVVAALPFLERLERTAQAGKFAVIGN